MAGGARLDCDSREILCIHRLRQACGPEGQTNEEGGNTPALGTVRVYAVSWVLFFATFSLLGADLRP